MRHAPLFILALGLSMLAVAGCERSPAATAAARPNSRIPRVVALGPAIARTIADSGHADLLAGRHAFDPWSKQSLPVCGDQGGVDYEALLAVRPTHVLMQWGNRELPPRLQRLARQHGWILRNYPLLSLQQVVDSGDELWSMFEDSPPDAATLPRARLARVLAHAPSSDGGHAQIRFDAARIGRVLLLASVHPPTALGPGSYHHQMLIALGATPALNSGAPYITLDAEDLLKLAPDAIILIQPRWGPRADGTPAATPAGGGEAGGTILDPAQTRLRLGKIADLNLPAIRRGRVALIDDPMAFIPGTNLINVAQDMAADLERWSAPGPAPAHP